MRHHGPAAPAAQGCGSWTGVGGGDPHHIPNTAPHRLGGTAVPGHSTPLLTGVPEHYQQGAKCGRSSPNASPSCYRHSQDVPCSPSPHPCCAPAVCSPSPSPAQCPAAECRFCCLLGICEPGPSSTPCHKAAQRPAAGAAVGPQGAAHVLCLADFI